MLKLVSYGRRLRVVFSMVDYSAARQKVILLHGFWSLEVVFHIFVFLFFGTSLYREVLFVAKVEQLYIREIKIVFYGTVKVNDSVAVHLSGGYVGCCGL